jgi:hypothetical protein
VRVGIPRPVTPVSYDEHVGLGGVRDLHVESAWRSRAACSRTLESGRREAVSVAEVLVLAAALNVAPIELMCPVGFDKQTEMLPGRMMDPPDAMRWFTGELKLELAEAATTVRQPGTAELSTTYLLKYHDDLIFRLRMKEAEAAKAAADAADAEAAKREVDEEVTTATMAAVDAEKTGDAAAAERARDAAGPAEARQMIAAVKAEYGAEDARRRMMAVAEWREFIREPLRRNREAMRSRGMMPPALPPDIELGEDDAP